MAIQIRVNESGKQHRIRTDFDMSSNTSLSIVYTKPSGAELSVSGTLGTTQVTIDGVTVAANQWLFYTFQPSELDEAGDYQVEVTYTNTNATPDDNFRNLTPITLTVGE